MLEIKVIALVVLNLVSSYIYGIASFGNGLIFQVGWQICSKISSDMCSGNTATASYYVSIAVLVIAPIQAIVLRNNIDWMLACNLSVPQISAAFVGVLLSQRPNVWVPRGLGAVMFSVSVIQLMLGVNCLKNNKTAIPVEKFNFDTVSKFLIVWSTGLLSGILSGMYAAGGPPIIVFLVYANIHKDTTRSTIAFCNAMLNTCRLAFYYYISVSSHRDEPESLAADWQTLGVALNVSSLVGLAVGNCMAGLVKQSLFMLIILTVLFAGSILLASFHCSALTTSFLSVIGVTIYVFIMILRSVYPPPTNPEPSDSNLVGVVTKYDSVPLEDEDCEQSAVNEQESPEIELFCIHTPGEA